MIQIDVIVLRRRTARKIDGWKCLTDDKGQLFAQYGDGRIPLAEAWRQLTLTILEKACDEAQETPYSNLQVDIFLIVRGRMIELIHREIEDDFKKLVNGAIAHTWGGNIYLAWVESKDVDFKVLYQGSELAFENWFRSLLSLGITDLIEIPGKGDETEFDIYRILHESVLKSEDRMGRLREFVSDDVWKVILRSQGQALAIKTFVRKFVGDDWESATHKNYAVFHDNKTSSNWSELLDQVPKDLHSRHLFVAVNSPKIVKDLEAILRRQSPGAEMFYFNSILEWLYAFIKLIAACCAEAEESLNSPAHVDDSVEWVESYEGATISSKPNTGDLRLLVTHTFHLNRRRAFDLDPDETRKREKHYLAAAAEIGEVRRSLPFHIKVEVHHSIICERLPGILRGRTFTAWLHLGHGKHGEGLKEEQTEQFAALARWTGCFHGYVGSVQLVMFSACESDDIARAFAKLGVPVAIGFENEVLTAAASQLSARVLPAAMRAGDRQATILNVFRRAAIELHGPSYDRINEEGFTEYESYSAAGPKAFAAKLKSS